MVPTIEALLSAHARTYQVATEGNVYESVAALLVPAVRIGLAKVPIEMAPVPDASVARWKLLVNPAPVASAPLLVMVELSVTAVPTVAAVGVMAPAMRFGPGAGETVTTVHAEQLLPSFDSAIALVLSAQARTYHVPAVKVLETFAVIVPPADNGCAVTI
jgi:hypothetical protein